MDNALKLLIGVLSISGVLALLTPTKPPIIATDPVPVSQPTPVNAPPEIAQASVPTSADASVATEDYSDELAQFGQPMNDAKPFGAPDEPTRKSEQADAPAAPAMTSGNQVDSGFATPVT